MDRQGMGREGNVGRAEEREIDDRRREEKRQESEEKGGEGMGGERTEEDERGGDEMKERGSVSLLEFPQCFFFPLDPIFERFQHHY